MKINLGDVIRVKEDNEEVNYLICSDNEKYFLVDLYSLYVLGAYEESSIEEFLENNEMELIEVIPGKELEIRRINSNSEFKKGQYE